MPWLCHTIAVLVIACGAPAPRAAAEPRFDADSVASADSFYERFQRPGWVNGLVGKTEAEMIEMLGHPSKYWVLDHEGHRWTQLAYTFTVVPSLANEEEREVFARGWKFSPGVLLRDGVVVPPERFDQEALGGVLYNAPPKLPWREFRSSNETGTGTGPAYCGPPPVERPRPRIEQHAPQGPSGEVANRYVRRALSEIRKCYEAALVDRPALRGTVEIEIVIGRRFDADVAAHGVSDRVDRCIASAVLASVRRHRGSPLSMRASLTLAPPPSEMHASASRSGCR